MIPATKPRVRGPAGATWFDGARPQPSAAYLRSQQLGASIFSFPAPTLRDASDDVKSAWVQAASRAIDVLHNNGWINGVVEALMSVMVGDGLKPNFKPDMSWAGWDQEQTSEWARRAEKRFEAYAADPWQVDAGGRYALAQLQAAAIRQWFATGEILAEILMIPRAGVQSSTKLRLLPSHWLSQRTDNLRALQQGVLLDGNAAPAGYLFEIKDRFNIGTIDVTRAARDAFGRPIIVHIFDGAAGQIRGITPIAPVLRVLRDYDQLSNATLAAAMIQAIFAATVESEYPASEVLDALKSQDEQDNLDDGIGTRFESFMDQKVGWHQNVNLDLGRNGKIAHMMMGETLKFNRSEHPNENYEAFANMLLREIARCAGALFEDLTGDYRGATYSSIRMGIAKQWPLLLYRRKHIPTPLSQRVAEAWLEEEIDRGDMEIPGGIDAFVANRSAICRMDWRGPAKPVADDVKAALAHKTYRDMGVITDEMICADLGVDHEDIYFGRAAEKAMREKLDIHGGITNGGTDIDELNAAAQDQPGDNQPPADTGQ